MKKRLFTTFTIILLGTLIWFVKDDFKSFFKTGAAFAVGDLTVDWEIGFGDVGPIFTVSDMAPGQMEERTVNVSNGAASARPVGVRGILTSDTASLSGVMHMVISEGVNDLYGGTSPTGPKTLSEFFQESAGPSGIPLSLLGPGADTSYVFKVTFDSSAGNEFQGQSVVFDLHIGISVDVPSACLDIDFGGKDPIFGTSGNDRIHGTLGNDLLVGFEGNDHIFGGGGDDCIIGGLGNDQLRGETGNDKIFGNEGNDLLIGAVGDDEIRGGDGNDTLRGEDGTDELHGENGNDVLRGGAGNDSLFGEDHNDSLFGESGNDSLTGGDGMDVANGASGADTCDAETETLCEL